MVFPPGLIRAKGGCALSETGLQPRPLPGWIWEAWAVILLGVPRAGRARSENTGKPAELEPSSLWVRRTSSVRWENRSNQGSSRPEKPCWSSRARDHLLPAQPRLKPVLAGFFHTQSQAGIGHLFSPKGPGGVFEGADRARPGRRAGRQGRAGDRKGRGGTRGRYGGGEGLPASPRPPPPFLPPPLDNFPPPRTSGHPRWRRVPSVSPLRPPRRGPNLSSSIRDPSERRLRTGSADGCSAPLLPELRAAPPPPRRP